MAKILIAGGSLGGLMVANLLWRAGHTVEVLERVVGNMDGRGAGIVTHPALFRGLHQCGLPTSDALGVAITERMTLDAQGQSLGQITSPQVFTSWSRLYHLLRDLLPGEFYRQGVQVQRVEQSTNGVTVFGQSNGAGVGAGVESQQFEGDLLIAADGIRSTVRQQLWPEVQSQYAGYVAWRGVCDEAALSRYTLDSIFPRFGFCLPPGEQFIGYPVAGAGNRMDVGQRAYNFVWYRPAATEGALQTLMTDADGVHHPQGIAPHKVAWRNVAQVREDARRLLAPQFAEMIEKTAQPFLQPIHDLCSHSMAQGRIALAGDAAFVARPHVGMGVTKAMQDAVALAAAVEALGATPAALQRYAAARLPASQFVIDRARELGAYMQASGRAGPAGLARDALAVMRDTAIDLEPIYLSLSPQPQETL